MTNECDHYRRERRKRAHEPGGMSWPDEWERTQVERCRDCGAYLLDGIAS